jgi:hypothetical protein
MVICALAAAAQGRDRHDWEQSNSRLQPGDQILLSLKTGPVTGSFQNLTPQAVTVGTVTAKRDDVIKIERYRQGRSRSKHAAIGALIGGGAGFGIGASLSLCGGLGPCISRPEAGAVAGGAGVVIGGLIGALLPVHTKELIYSARK